MAITPLMPVYPRSPVRPVRGEGVYLYGEQGERYLDFAAGIATLKVLRDTNPYPRLEQLGAQLAAGLRQAGEEAGLPHCVNRVGSMLTLFFQAGPVTDWESASRSDTGRFARYFWRLIERGTYKPCSQYEALFISTAHTGKDIEATIAAARDALCQIAASS